MRFIDTNIFLRFMLEDDLEKQAACAELFRRIAAGEEVATTSETVLAEVMYVTTSPRTYRVPVADACLAVRSLVTLSGLRVTGKPAALRALDLFEQFPSLGFEDALYIAHAELDGLDGIYSYDRGIDRVPGVHRIEPPTM